MFFPVTTFPVLDLYLAGGSMLNVHGSSTYFLISAALVGAIVLPWELTALVWGLLQLHKQPQLRVRLNVLALLAAGTYVVGAVVWVLVISGGAL